MSALRNSCEEEFGPTFLNGRPSGQSGRHSRPYVLGGAAYLLARRRGDVHQAMRRQSADALREIHRWLDVTLPRSRGAALRPPRRAVEPLCFLG